MGVTNANNLVLHNVYLKTVSSNSNLPKNTDALDISSSQNIIFKDSNLFVGDDCTAINGGVRNVTIDNVHCTGGHGFRYVLVCSLSFKCTHFFFLHYSVGSLGKGGATETVSDITVINSICTNCQNGLRIKTWPGGKGSVSKVKFDNNQIINSDNPVIVTTHYCDKNQMSYCTKEDSTSLSISGVTISRISGSASSKGNAIFNVNCSTKAPCSGFSVSGLTITKSSKTPKNVCTNLSGSNKLSVCSQ